MATPPIYVVSGGAGASGDLLVQTVLAQFPKSDVPVVIMDHVLHIPQVRHVVAEAAASGGTIVHTMINYRLRCALEKQASERGVTTIDLMGPLMDRLTEMTGEKPVGRPGRYRQLQHAYFDRIEAIRFSMAHDDGKDPEGWAEADIVLVGVSRVGKTPLSMYLSVLGWKVANVPLVPGVPAPPQLLALDRQRVICLTIEPGQLIRHREERQHRLGLPPTPSGYASPLAVFQEVEDARQNCRRHGFTVIDITDKPIEATAADITSIISRRFGIQRGQEAEP